MTLQLGSQAPNFAANTTHGSLEFHDFIKDSWTMLFSHPDDYTPVCTTELGELAKVEDKFYERGVKLIGLSANDLNSHYGWIKDIDELHNTKLRFPIIADKNREVARLYDMLDALDPTNVDHLGIPLTVRTVFIIDPSKTIRLMMSYPASTGRHFGELLRVIDSLQLGDKYKVTTPANWQQGDRVIVHPSVKNDDLEKTFGTEVEHLKPYLRLTKDPSNN